jgi:hypothetical protein
MERYCLRVVHPKHDGWWVVSTADYRGECISIGLGFAIAQHAAGVSSWSEPELTTAHETVQAEGYDSVRIPLEVAQKMQ